MPLKIVIHKFLIEWRQQNHETTHDPRIILQWKPKVRVNVQRQYYYCKPNDERQKF